MSHFTILCVGNVDYNLAPFHEFESTGCNDEFVETLDITKEEKDRYKKAKESYKEKLAEYEEACKSATSDEEKEAAKVKFAKDIQYMFKGETFREFLETYGQTHIVGQDEEIDIEGKCKYGYAIEHGEDDFKVCRRTNPNSIWDWYVVGGRWDGKLLLKEKDEEGNDIYTNQAMKGEIDFEEMWRRDEEKERTKYRKVIKILGKVPVIPHTWVSLVEICKDKNGRFNREEASNIYDAQEDYILWKNKEKEMSGLIGWDDLPEYFSCTEDEYVKNSSVHAITYGIIKDRKYLSKGDIGWWGCSSNEKEPVSWDEEYKKAIEECDDDELISIVDCHI